MPGPRQHLSVDLELDSDSLSGTVSSDGEGTERFNNWLELMGAVEGRRPEAEIRLSEQAEPASADQATDTSEENER